MPQRQTLSIILQQQLVGAGKSVGQGVAHDQRAGARGEVPAAGAGAEPADDAAAPWSGVEPAVARVVGKGGRVMVLETGSTGVAGWCVPCWAPSICW